MNFFKLLSLQVFVVYAPSSILYSEILVLFLEVLNASDKMLFNCRDDPLKAIHFCLDNAVNIVDMFQSCFFEVQKSLFRICSLLLYNTLTTKHIALHFFKGLVLVANLLTNNSSLVCQIHTSLLLGTLNDLVHSAETVLDLFHEATFALETLLLIALHLVK